VTPGKQTNNKQYILYVSFDFHYQENNLSITKRLSFVMGKKLEQSLDRPREFHEVEVTNFKTVGT